MAIIRSIEKLRPTYLHRSSKETGRIGFGRVDIDYRGIVNLNLIYLSMGQNQNLNWMHLINELLDLTSITCLRKYVELGRAHGDLEPILIKLH